MAQTKQSHGTGTSTVASSSWSRKALRNAESILPPEKEFFTLAARAALTGCTLHRIEFKHTVIYRLECLDGALMLSHPHDVAAAITARGGVA